MRIQIEITVFEKMIYESEIRVHFQRGVVLVLRRCLKIR